MHAASKQRSTRDLLASVSAEDARMVAAVSNPVVSRVMAKIYAFVAQLRALEGTPCVAVVEAVTVSVAVSLSLYCCGCLVCGCTRCTRGYH